MCECATCVRLRAIEARIQELPEEQRDFFRCMVDSMLDVEFDNQYYKAILDGKWPGAEAILRRSLTKIEKKEGEIND
jgi:hypothetical protein